jgi:hypothetical protein
MFIYDTMVEDTRLGCAGGDQVPADPEHPLPQPSDPGPCGSGQVPAASPAGGTDAAPFGTVTPGTDTGPGTHAAPTPAGVAPAGARGIPADAVPVLAGLSVRCLAVEEDQEHVLAWELAAFPAEEEPTEEELEYLDPGFDDHRPDAQEAWLADLPAPVLDAYLAATAPSATVTAPVTAAPVTAAPVTAAPATSPVTAGSEPALAAARVRDLRRAGRRTRCVPGQCWHPWLGRCGRTAWAAWMTMS